VDHVGSENNCIVE
jgi:translation elongation factor EF-G